jgi:hypothetical protein
MRLADINLNDIKVKLFDLSVYGGVPNSNLRVLENAWAFHSIDDKAIGLSDWSDSNDTFFSVVTVYYNDDVDIVKVELVYVDTEPTSEYFGTSATVLKELFSVNEIHCKNYNMNSIEEYDQDDIDRLNLKSWIL